MPLHSFKRVLCFYDLTLYPHGQASHLDYIYVIILLTESLTYFFRH